MASLDQAAANLDQERVIIHRLKNGDRPALATLYAWYGERLYRQAILPRLPTVELAEDILKDTFKIAMERIDQFEPRGPSIYHWLERIAVNRVTSHYRAELVRFHSQEAVGYEYDRLSAEVPSPDRSVEIEEVADLVRRSLEKVEEANPTYAEVLRLRLLEDRSIMECAEQLGVSGGHFNVMLHRACKAFRKVFPP